MMEASFADEVCFIDTFPTTVMFVVLKENIYTHISLCSVNMDLSC